MNNSIRYLFALLLISLVSLFGLQLYFGIQTYHEEFQTLEKEINKSLVSSVEKAHQERIEKISRYFSEDLKDSSLVSLKVKKSDDGPRLFISEPSTGLTTVSVIYEGILDDTISISTLKKYLIERNKTYLLKGSVMYWNPSLGERLKSYNDTIKIQEVSIKKHLSEQLELKDIKATFSLLWDISENKKKKTSSYELYSDIIPIPLHKNQFVQVKINTIREVIFQRMKLIITIIIVVFLLVVTSFIFLLQFIRKERRLSQLKDDFISNITHEMLTPITAQRLALEKLQKDKNTKENPMVGILNEQTIRFEELINQSLKANFQIQKNGAVKHKIVSPFKIVQDVISYEINSSNKTVEYTINIPEKLEIKTDIIYLKQVLHNLIINAITYNDSTIVKLELNYTENNRNHHFQIHDNGIGIPKSDQKLIFEKFHRVANDESYRNNGLGVGLYFSKKIMKELNGNLKLIQSTNNGSTFEIIIPKKI